MAQPSMLTWVVVAAGVASCKQTRRIWAGGGERVDRVVMDSTRVKLGLLSRDPYTSARAPLLIPSLPIQSLRHVPPSYQSSHAAQGGARQYYY